MRKMLSKLEAMLWRTSADKTGARGITVFQPGFSSIALARLHHRHSDVRGNTTGLHSGRFPIHWLCGKKLAARSYHFLPLADSDGGQALEVVGAHMTVAEGRIKVVCVVAGQEC